MRKKTEKKKMKYDYEFDDYGEEDDDSDEEDDSFDEENEFEVEDIKDYDEIYS